MNGNFLFSSSISTPTRRIAKPSSEFYSAFSEEEILGIFQALEVRREFPLKYAYKGKGASIWDNFYLNYISPKWYRNSTVEIDLLKDNFELINENLKGHDKVNIIDVGAGNSYPVKAFISRLNQLGKINQYIALDISEELLNISRLNFRKWFPSIEFASYKIDLETSCLSQVLLKNQATSNTDETAKIFLHLGVTIGNHHDRIGVLKNLRNTMGKNDLLVFTNELGSSAQWDGKARGGCKYHADQVYKWIQNKIQIRAKDCELVRRYDEKIDSIVANLKLRRDYSLNFRVMGIDKTLQISQGEEITIWRHHRYEVPELLQELEQAGLKLVHYSTNKYLSHILVICKV